MFTNLYCTLICKHTLLETDDSTIFTCSFFLVLCVCLFPRIHKICSDFLKTWVRKLNKSYSIWTCNFKIAGTAVALRPLDVFWVPGAGGRVPRLLPGSFYGHPMAGPTLCSAASATSFLGVYTLNAFHNFLYCHVTWRHRSCGRRSRRLLATAVAPSTPAQQPLCSTSAAPTECWTEQLLKCKELFLIK